MKEGNWDGYILKRINGEFLRLNLYSIIPTFQHSNVPR